MKITLYDFEPSTKEFEIGELEDIVSIEIMILSGDELACVTYKDRTVSWFDSSEDRFTDYYDGGYTIYDIADGTNIIDAWKERKDSYDNNWWDLVG